MKKSKLAKKDSSVKGAKDLEKTPRTASRSDGRRKVVKLNSQKNIGKRKKNTEIDKRQYYNKF